MIDLPARFASAPHYKPAPDPYQEEAAAAFRVRAEEALDRLRETGDRYPVILLLHSSSPYASRIAVQMTARTAGGWVVEVPHHSAGVRAFVLPHSLAAYLLKPLGRTVWGLDFDLHLGRQLDEDQFFEVTAHEGKLVIRHCWPGPRVTA